MNSALAITRTLRSMPWFEERPELVGALVFVEAVGNGVMDGHALVGWIDEHLVSPGRSLRSSRVTETGARVVDLGRLENDHGEVARLVRTARARVVGSMGAFISGDDRFLAAAIFAGRVRRVRLGTKSLWVARPRVDDALSDIVLSLFAVDILGHREDYDRWLSVCDECGRIGFNADVAMRRACDEHPAWARNLDAADSGIRVRSRP